MATRELKCSILHWFSPSSRLLYISSRTLSGNWSKQGELDMQGDFPLLNIQLGAGDQPVSRTVLWPHGHLRRLDKLEQPLGPNGHGWPSGEHTGVDVNPRRPPLLRAGARRRRERLGGSSFCPTASPCCAPIWTAPPCVPSARCTGA